MGPWPWAPWPWAPGPGPRAPGPRAPGPGPRAPGPKPQAPGPRPQALALGAGMLWAHGIKKKQKNNTYCSAVGIIFCLKQKQIASTSLFCIIFLFYQGLGSHIAAGTKVSAPQTLQKQAGSTRGWALDGSLSGVHAGCAPRAPRPCLAPGAWPETKK